MDVLRAIYKYWTALVFVLVLVQVGAAGYGAFYAAKKSDPGPLKKHAFDHGFSFHNGFGYIIFAATVILFVLALAARFDRKRLTSAGAAPLLLVIQIALAKGGESHPIIGIFHPINALLIFGLTGSLAFTAWRGTHSSS